MFQDTIPTSTLSSKILSFLTVGDQITHLYTTAGKVTVSYTLTLTLLMWRIWWAPNNASRWQMEINSTFKGLNRLIFQRQQYISISVHDSTICCSIIKGPTLAAGRAIRITKTSFVAPIWETKRAYVSLLHLLLIFIKFISRVLLPACNSYVC